jgi:hypothetical protein
LNSFGAKDDVFEKVGNTYGFDVTKLKEVIVRRSS